MILYTNGSGHTAAAEAVNTFAFAEDDPQYLYLHRKPHPHNLVMSYGAVLASWLKMSYYTDAESASSNSRIIRTTKEWIANTKHITRPSEVLMIIQWSTWEREEWLINNTYYQVNTSGVDNVPPEYQDQYKQWVANIDWDISTKQAHHEICEFGRFLDRNGYKFIFFNGNTTFESIADSDRFVWGNSYIGAYSREGSFDGWLRSQGYETVITSNYHYGPNAHAAWARYLLRHITENKLL